VTPVQLAGLKRRPGRRHLALGDHPLLTVLDDECALPAVHVEANVVLAHRAAFLSDWAPPWMTPWSAANLIAAEGSLV